ncbi:MAG TPA: type II 3-dehydroquinate dehydratase [Chloroflexota bacterium]|nr:type II 3-dehydroquinate dehydratase [Chloroflexota bacterium]
MKILVLHGPNLNLFGRREPHIYGSVTLAEIDERIAALAKELAIDVEAFQSNHEGALLDKLHSCIDEVQGCLLNPGALTQYSVALYDAIKAMPFPVLEVHLSNLHQREEWRRHSIIGQAAKGTIQGLGWRSYTAALRALVEILREASDQRSSPPLQRTTQGASS